MSSRKTFLRENELLQGPTWIHYIPTAEQKHRHRNETRVGLFSDWRAVVGNKKPPNTNALPNPRGPGATWKNTSKGRMVTPPEQVTLSQPVIPIRLYSDNMFIYPAIVFSKSFYIIMYTTKCNQKTILILKSFLSTGESDQTPAKEDQGWKIRYQLSGSSLEIVAELVKQRPVSPRDRAYLIHCDTTQIEGVRRPKFSL